MAVGIFAIELEPDAPCELLVTRDHRACLRLAREQELRGGELARIIPLVGAHRRDVRIVTRDHEPARSPPHAGDRIILLPDIAAAGRGTDPRGELRAGNERAQQL